MSLKTIVSRLGGELYDGGRRAKIPAPGHSRLDRSVSLRQDGARLLVHCFGTTDWREVRDHLRELGLLAADSAATASGADAAAPIELDAAARRAAAARIWSAGRPLGRSLSARHCGLRGIESPLPGPDALRHGPSTPLFAYRRDGPAKPALLAAIRDSSGRLSALEITYLTHGGQRDWSLRLPRKTVGTVPPGSAVRLAAPARAMLVAEGVFTTLSAMRRFRLPGWALSPVANLKRWAPPEGVEAVLIAADRGLAGEAAAEDLRRALIGQGVDAAVAAPPAPFGDWNEAETAAR